MTQYALILVAGMAGSFHCIGMCGGFACALGADSRGGSARVLRQLIYNTGRVTSYIFIGALAGALGAALVGHAGIGNPVGPAQRGLALVSGLLMVFIGLQFFGFFTRLHGTALGVGGQIAVQSLRGLLKAPGAAAPLALGVLNGFLPCPLVYAFAAQAASRGDPLPGALVMAAFGLGTFPAMLLMAGIGGWLAPAWRRKGVRLAGAFIVVLGLITLGRGVIPLTGHGGPL